MTELLAINEKMYQFKSQILIVVNYFVMYYIILILLFLYKLKISFARISSSAKLTSLSEDIILTD